MQFFLYEVVARIVSVYLCVVCYRTLRAGLAERKITSWSSDPIDWILTAFMDPSIRVAHRDTAPVRYWILMGIQVLGLVGCCGVAIFGWWHPTA
jgi:CHASE2 domain-containing sensor protein